MCIGQHVGPCVVRWVIWLTPLLMFNLAGGIVQEDEYVDGVDGGLMPCVFVCFMLPITVC